MLLQLQSLPKPRITNQQSRQLGAGAAAMVEKGRQEQKGETWYILLRHRFAPKERRVTGEDMLWIGEMEVDWGNRLICIVSNIEVQLNDSLSLSHSKRQFF